MSVLDPNLRRHLLALFLCWSASVPVAEVVFRSIGDKPSDDLAGLYVPFGERSYKLGPAVSTEAKWAAGRFTVHTDSLGLRCDTEGRLACRPGHTIDFLFLGDSQGFGNGVRFRESVAGSAAEFARANAIRCANASVGGHKLRNQFGLARWLHDKERLRIAHYVLLLTPAMIQDPNGYAHAAVGSDGRLYDKPPTMYARARLWLKTHSVLYGRIRDAALNSGLSKKPAWNATESVFSIYDARESIDIARDRLVRVLQQFMGFAAQNGADVSLVYVPLTVEIQSDALRQAAAQRGIALDLDRSFSICSSVATHLGLRLHDLRPVLRKVLSEGHSLRSKNDFHYNPILSEACGSSIWTYLSGFAHSPAGA